MANIILRWLHFAIFFTTLIFIDVAYSANTVKVYNGYTTYYELGRSSVRGGTVGGLPATHSYNTNVGRPIPVTQLSKQGIEIPAIKIKTPFAARFGWNAAKVRDAVKFGLKLGKTNLYTIAGTTALAYVLDEIGWFDDDGVLSYRPDPNAPDVTVVPFENAFISSHNSLLYDSPVAACAVTAGCEQYGACNPTIRSFDADKQLALGWCYSTDPENGYGSWWQVKACPHNTVIVDKGCALLDAEPRSVTDSMIDALDLDDYSPTDKDIPMISPYLGEPDEIVITEQPTPIVLPTETTTTQNPDGSTTTTATDTTVNVTINTT